MLSLFLQFLNKQLVVAGGAGDAVQRGLEGLEIDASYLYLHANKEARVLSARWQAQAKGQGFPLFKCNPSSADYETPRAMR